MDDFIEEETVVRETMEECGVTVKPIRKLYTCPADTKVFTVSFWETESLSSLNLAVINGSSEIDAVRWFSINEILSGVIPLYPGTKKFFSLIEGGLTCEY